MKGKVGLQIHHADESGDRVIYEEPVKIRSGLWQSPSLPISGIDGRYYLTCQLQGPFSLHHFQWNTQDTSNSEDSFLLSITTYKSAKALDTIRDICLYEPLNTLKLSLLVVDNAQVIRRDQLPNDHRLHLVSQPNLGATGGYIRSLRHARFTEADYLVTLADDDMVLHPETLYRMMAFQCLTLKPIAVGSMMLYLDRPTLVHEQGATVPKRIYTPMRSINNQIDLTNPRSFRNLYRENICDYSGWWLLSRPVAVSSFLPAFFLYGDDILEGILLGKNDIQTIIPPHLFIWQTFGYDLKSFRTYLMARNELALRFSAEYPISAISTLTSFFQQILKNLSDYDYFRAEFFLLAFEDVLQPLNWISNPLKGVQRIQKIRSKEPPIENLSERLSKSYLPNRDKKRHRLVSMTQKFLSILTLNGYFNPFAKLFSTDGGLVYRSKSDHDSWQWIRYKQLAVIDQEKNGYICKRSWRKMASILGRSIQASLIFWWALPRLKKEYVKPSNEWEAVWGRTFEVIDRD